MQVPHVFCDDSGDVDVVIADNAKAVKLLEWFPKKKLYDMCRDGWLWQKQNPNGF